MITLNRKVRFSHPDFSYGNPSYTEYLFGSIGLKVTADIRIDVKWETLEINLNFDATNQRIERIQGGSFIVDGFKDSDTIVVSGTVSNNGNYTILQATDDYIYTTTAVINEIVISSIKGNTPIISMDFYPNLISNYTDFDLHNLTDRDTIPRYFADTITTDSANPTVMQIASNSHGWVTPSDRATIYRSSIAAATTQTFIISHTFNITPIYLVSQLQNLQHKLPPVAGQYKDRDCLKYVYTIDGKFTAYDPTIPHTTDGNVFFPNGQTGWFNEFINGRPTVWTKKSIAYSDNSTGGELSTIDYCKVVNVDSRLDCQVTVGSKYIVQVMYLPQTEDRYVNTETDFKTNFIYESAVVTVGVTAQGENTGDYHFLKNVIASYLTANSVKITFQIDFSKFLEDTFDCLDPTDLNYLIFITAQNSLDASILAINQTAVIMDVNVLNCDKDDSTLFKIIDEVQFFEYPKCTGTGYSSFNLLPHDTIIAKAQFHVKQGTELTPIILQSISASLVAVKKNDVEQFPLESFTINTSGFLPNCNNIQEIEFNQERDFILPTNDCRNEIRLFRMPTLDITGYSAYELIYPFKVRWEEWRPLNQANNCFNAPTQNWMVYANTTGWSIKFSINAKVLSKSAGSILLIPSQVTNCAVNNPILTEFEHITWGTIKDPCDIPYAVEFNTFDITGENSYEEIIGKDVNTFVVSTIKGDFSGYTVNQLYGILSLDAWGIGGVSYSQEIGTRIAVDANGVWYGKLSILMATLTKVSNNTLTLSAFLNYKYLPKDTNQFILSARIGLYESSASSSGATCLNEIEVLGFTCGELEILEVVNSNTIIVSGNVETNDARLVFLDAVSLTFVTATTWKASGGKVNGNFIMSGSVGGLIISAPIHPYTNSIVGDTIQGQVSGTVYTSIIKINGI